MSQSKGHNKEPVTPVVTQTRMQRNHKTGFMSECVPLPLSPPLTAWRKNVWNQLSEADVTRKVNLKEDFFAF